MADNKMDLPRSFTYNGKGVGLRLMTDGQGFIKTRSRIVDSDTCPICRKVFTKDNTTSIVLIISNQIGIPNKFVHIECMEDKTPEYAFKIIADDYKEALKYKHWFI